MEHSLRAQLNLVYKSFQWYADRISSSEFAGLDDKFIAAYDNHDVKYCKAVLTAMSGILHDLTDGNMSKADVRKWG